MISRFLKWLRRARSARRLIAHQAAEILSLRQQLAMYTRREKKPRFNQRDRLFWVILYRFWSGWCKNWLEVGVRRLEESSRSVLQSSAYSLLFHHMIILNERHLESILKEYFAYYHDDRTHYNLRKDTPFSRPVQPKLSDGADVLALPRLGGMLNYYHREAA